jgi:hypothetical protein
MTMIININNVIMNLLRQTYSEIFSRRSSLIVPVATLIIIMLSSCRETPVPYSLVEITGSGNVMNYSKSPLWGSYVAESDKRSTSLLGSPGDILLFDDFSLFRLRGDGLAEFKLSSTNDAEYLNGKVISLTIPSKSDSVPLFSKMNSDDLSELGFISVDSLIPESYYPYLIDLAAMKPGLGIGIDYDHFTAFDKLFTIINPSLLSAGTVSYTDFRTLEGLTNIETLILSIKDTLPVIPLPALPKLKKLYLSEISDEVLSDKDFLVNNPQIESILISNSGIVDFDFLDHLVNLKELLISGSDTLLNPDLISKHRNLELVSVVTDGLGIVPGLDKLKKIRWFAFSTDVTQSQFDSFISEHPSLEVVEIFENDTIASLKPLLNLKKLYGLAILDTLTDIATVKQMTNLKYLSLPEEVYTDSARMKLLNEALPGTKIVANQGFCLGSGWLLLLIPMIAVFVFIRRRKSHLV